MDFLNKAKDLLQDDNKSSSQQQQQQQPQGGSLPPGNKAQGGAYGLPGGDDNDFRGAADQASSLAGSHGDKDLFSSVLSSLGTTNKPAGGAAGGADVDESSILDSFKKFASGGQAPAGEKADEKSLGGAAAMQALKLFNSGETKGQKDTQGGFVALALAEGSKLFDDRAKSGQVAEGTTKQGVLQQAGEIAMKLYMKSQIQKQGGDGLASLAGKFLK